MRCLRNYTDDGAISAFYPHQGAVYVVKLAVGGYYGKAGSSLFRGSAGLWPRLGTQPLVPGGVHYCTPKPFFGGRYAAHTANENGLCTEVPCRGPTLIVYTEVSRKGNRVGWGFFIE